jgi:homopolymeric O-antigen transport system permease protein
MINYPRSNRFHSLPDSSARARSACAPPPFAEHVASALPVAAFRHRGLFIELVRREIELRYRGSMFGVIWSLIAPVLMLAVFTFVFSTVFEARWGRAAGDHGFFALMLFPGMIIYGFFAEVMARAPGVIVAQPNYVRKIVFPVAMLPAVAVASAGFQALIGLVVVVVFELILTGSVPPTALWLPLILLPFVIFLFGIGWLLSSLGVYLRDIAQVTGVIATAFMFLSPVFYPVDSLPVQWRAWTAFNPLTLIIEDTRKVLILGQSPDFASLAMYCALAVAFAASTLYWFQRTRKGFADVL